MENWLPWFFITQYPIDRATAMTLLTIVFSSGGFFTHGLS
jgi:hypothetical protein